MGGLLTTFEQKKKISSLLIAYGNEVTNDPTRFEQEIWRQMALKQETFNINNLSRKLTSMEFKDKNNRKYFSGSLEIHIAVYKISSLKHPQNKYKININAFENHLSGVCLINDKCDLLWHGEIQAPAFNRFRTYKDLLDTDIKQ